MYRWLRRRPVKVVHYHCLPIEDMSLESCTTMTMDIGIFLPNLGIYMDQERMVMNSMKFLMVHLPLTSSRLCYMKAFMEPLLFLFKSLLKSPLFRQAILETPTFGFPYHRFIMDVTSLSNTLERMSMEDIAMTFKALKDAQLKNQALQEENRRLLTTPSVPKPTGSLVLSPDDSAAADAGSSLNDSASNTKTPSLFESKESRKQPEYCAMKMVVFAHIWFKRKGLFGIGLESACRELDAATLTNSLDAGVERPSPERIMVLQLVLKLYELLSKVFYPLAGATVMGEYHEVFRIVHSWYEKSGVWPDRPYMKHVGGLQRLNFLNRFRNLAAEIFKGIRLLGFKSAGVYNRHPPCLFADGFVTGATVFRTIYGVKILTCLLWGGTALDDQRIVTKGTNADLWHMTEVTPAAIAFAAIVDQLKKGTKSMQDTVKFYNDHVFPTTRDHRSTVPTTVPLSLNEEEEIFWHELEALDKEPDLDSEGVGPTPLTSAVSVDTPSAVSSQVEPPAILVPVTNDAHLCAADANDKVRSKAKGTKGKKSTRAAISTAAPAATSHMALDQGTSTDINVEEGDDDEDEDEEEDEDE
ncbi:hypothetical protein ARMGADRAFT_1039035 [Armillaria gallica]|uniref:Uncharacterized protein n=1 Tax=Armillaria gallica TaxID=47427 RepID=A0A2H3CFI5_ARMGA|nr:hypothetical protein ARMGADRAFT_1039035 [Armillaria gallica]